MTTAKTAPQARTGESPDAKSKRMAESVPARIAETTKAAAAIYDVVQPASVHQSRRKSATRKAS